MTPHIVKTIIEESKQAVRQIVETSQTDSKTIIQRYTAAVAINFTDWIGKTLPWARHEYARYALTDNLRCEAVQDHVGMLMNFAKLSNALPDGVHYREVGEVISVIRQLFADPNTAGLAGIALCGILENTSEIFIPDLERRASELGCTDLTYTKVHGVADVEHSDAFGKATIAEFEMGYNCGDEFIQKAANLAVHLIRVVYS